MTQVIERFISSIFGENVVLATIIIAMIPAIELKGAIPFSMSKEIWADKALSLWQAFGCGVLGGAIIVPLLALLYAPIIKWLKSTKFFRSLAIKIENKISRKKKNIEEDIKNKSSDRKKLWGKIIGVFIFVAIPIPMTGVWTGTCIAVALGLSFGVTCLTVISANAVAGLLITLVSSFFGDATMIFVYIIFAIIIVIGFIILVKKLIDRKNHPIMQDEQNEN